MDLWEARVLTERSQNRPGVNRGRYWARIRRKEAKMSARKTKTGSHRYVKLSGRRSGLPFSDAVLAGDTLYLAGRLGLDSTTGKVPAEIGDELKLLFDGFEAVLKQADMTMDDLVSVQVFSPDVSLWERFNEEYLKR